MDAFRASGVELMLRMSAGGIVVLVVEGQPSVGVDQGETSGMQTAGIETVVVEGLASVGMLGQGGRKKTIVGRSVEPGMMIETGSNGWAAGGLETALFVEGVTRQAAA